MADTDNLVRIKTNVSTMVSKGASEAEIDQYVAGEGTSADVLKGVSLDPTPVVPKVPDVTAPTAGSPNIENSAPAGGYGQQTASFNPDQTTANNMQDIQNRLSAGQDTASILAAHPEYAPHKDQIDQASAAYKSGYKGPVQWTAAANQENPDIVVNGKKNTQNAVEQASQAVATNAHDALLGVPVGLVRGTRDAAGGWIEQAAEKLGISAPGSADAAAQTRQQDEASLDDRQFYNQDGSATAVGKFLGGILPYLLSKNPAGVEAGLGEKVVGHALTGGAIGAAQSGGQDVAQNAAQGAMLSSLIGGAVDSIHAGAPKGLPETRTTASDIEVLKSYGIDHTDLPEGVDPKSIVDALYSLHATKLEAENFKGTPDPKATDVFPNDESRASDADAWGAKLQADATKYNNNPEPEASSDPRVTDISPPNYPTPEDDEALLSSHGLNASHFSSPEEMQKVVGILRKGDGPVEPTSYDADPLTDDNNRNSAAWFNRKKPTITDETPPEPIAAAPKEVAAPEPSQPVASTPATPEEVAASNTKFENDIKGKDIHGLAQYIAETAPDEATRTIAQKVQEKLKNLVEAGHRFKMSVINVGDSAPTPISRGNAKGLVTTSLKNDGADVHLYLRGQTIDPANAGTNHEIALHELLHATTMTDMQLANKSIAAGSKAQPAIVDLYDVFNHVITQFNKNARDKTMSPFEEKFFKRENNTLSSVDELVAYAMTNKDMQTHLESIKMPTGQTAFSTFVQSIRKMLGLTPSSDTALSRVIGNTETLLGSDSRELVHVREKMTAPSEGRAAAEDNKEPAISKKDANALYDSLLKKKPNLTTSQFEKALQKQANDFSAKKASQTPEPIATAKPADTSSPAVSEPVTTEQTVDKLTAALGTAKGVKPEQLAMQKAERVKRVAAAGAAGDALTGKAASDARLGALSGEMPKPDFEAVGDQFTPKETDALHQAINEHPTLGVYGKVTASTGLKKLMGGAIPNASEIDALSKVFPTDFMQAAIKKSNRFLPEDWLTSWHYAAMLSGYKSLVHNVIGHFFGSVANNLTHGVASTLGSVGKKLGVLGEDAQTLGDFNNRMYGYGRILTDNSLYADTLESFKKNQIKQDANSTADFTQGPKIPGVFTAPERLHSASYTFFGEAEKAANLYQAAGKQARSEGLTGNALTERIDELAIRPTDEMSAKALGEANATRMMGEGGISKALNKFLGAPEPEDYLMRLVRFGVQNVAPFAKIAEQKFLSTARYVPILDKMDPFARQQWKDGTAGKQMVISRYMLGMAAMTFAYKTAGSVDELGKDIVAEMPILNLIKTSRDAIDNYKALTAKSSDSEITNATEAVFSAASTFASQMQDQTFMKSIGDYFVARSRGDTNPARQYWARQAQGWMPYAAASKEAAGFVDPTPRDTRAPTLSGTVANTIKADTPFVSESLPVDQLKVNTDKMKEQGATQQEVLQYMRLQRSQESRDRKKAPK